MSDSKQIIINGFSGSEIAKKLDIKINKKTFNYYENTDEGFELFKTDFLALFPLLKFNKSNMCPDNMMIKAKKIDPVEVNICTGDDYKKENIVSSDNHWSKLKYSKNDIAFYSTDESHKLIDESELLNINSNITKNKQLKYESSTVDIILYNGKSEVTYPAISYWKSTNQYYINKLGYDGYNPVERIIVGGESGYRNSKTSFLTGRFSAIIRISHIDSDGDMIDKCFLIQGVKNGSGTLFPTSSLLNVEEFNLNILNDSETAKQFDFENILERHIVKTKNVLLDDSIHKMSLNSFVNSVTSTLVESGYTKCFHNKYTLSKNNMENLFNLRSYQYDISDGRLFFFKENSDGTVDAATFYPKNNKRITVIYRSSFFKDFNINLDADLNMKNIECDFENNVLTSNLEFKINNLNPKLIKVYVNKMKQFTS